MIAMEMPELAPVSKHPLHKIDPSAIILELTSAPDSPMSKKPSTSSASLQTLGDSKKDNPLRLHDQKEEHRISIPNDSSSTTAQCDSSQDINLAMCEINSGLAQYVSIPTQESSVSTRLGRWRPGDFVENWKRASMDLRTIYITMLAFFLLGVVLAIRGVVTLIMG
ncbi:hypothetical protein MJO28_004965 [Puccinia striiformis f. sp. tritici]|nr:hypothetical protein MJO28_004942 [Puccinia striiformis f. sp. tritici]KAI7954565.1 hypothetical protein MJO28_004965 [Puccinia striiformis f. sp. tritici]